MRCDYRVFYFDAGGGYRFAAGYCGEGGLGRPARVVHGGDTRQQSVANALAEVDPTTEIVLVHDAVRPFVTLEQIERVIAEARTRGAAIRAFRRLIR